ncbi:SEC-C metal-binding domain-containing protein [Bacillus licheniformis]|nr:SEC-C metal-binding domain-containing protein [Bacillus licheniformis]
MPCPCGSGLKYKNAAAKQRERFRLSRCKN